MKISRGISPKQVAESIVELSDLSDQWFSDHLAQGKKQINTYFAIDADVVRMFLLPDEEWRLADIFWRARPSQSIEPNAARRRKVETQEDETAQLLARLIADFIFGDDPAGQATFPERAYVVIPSHNEEIAAMLVAIANDAEATSRRLAGKIRGVLDDLGPIFENYRKSESKDKDKDFAKALTQSAPEVVELYSVLANSATAIDRFVSIGSQRLVPLVKLQTKSGESILDLLPVNYKEQVEAMIPDWLDVLLPKEDLERRLQDKGDSPAFDDKRVSRANDARVLATLDIINQVLFERDERMMLMTASPHIYHSLQNYRLRERNYDPHGTSLFVDLFLRHPRWVISDPAFFFTDVSPRTQINLQRWLEILASGKDYRERLLPDTSKKLSEIPREWNSVIRFLATLRYGESLGDSDWSETTDTKISAEVLKKLLNIAESAEWKKGKLGELMRRPATESLSRLYTTSTLLGLFEQAKEGPTAARAMPALCFDPPYEGFHKSYTKLRAVLRQAPGRQGATLDAIQGVFDQMHVGKDITSYHRHIIHAAAYAMFENWGPVLTLCQLAIQIAENVRRSTFRGLEMEVIRGREAAFLATIASRRSAKSVADLQQAEVFLNLAIDRDPDEKNGPNIRFRSEQAAIDTRRVYFRYFERLEPRVALEYRELLNLLERLIIEATTSYSVPEARKREEMCPYICQWVLVQCYTNLFSLLLIELDGGQRDIFSDKYLQLLQRFALFMEQGGTEYAGSDPYVITVCELALVVTGSAANKTGELAAKIAERLKQARRLEGGYIPARRLMFTRLLEKYGSTRKG